MYCAKYIVLLTQVNSIDRDIATLFYFRTNNLSLAIFFGPY